MTNFADREARTDWLAERPDPDLPDASETQHDRPRINAWPKLCAGSWHVQHDNPASVADCPECAPGWDEPPC